MATVCKHRHYVKFNVTLLGMGNTKDEAFEDALAHTDYKEIFDSLEMVSITQLEEHDECFMCEDENG